MIRRHLASIRRGTSRELRSQTVIAALICSFSLLSQAPNAFAKASFVGTWQVTLTFPDAPGSTTNHTEVITMNVSPRGDSLVGRMVITDDQGNTFGGVWRQVGKKISVTFELPCVAGAAAPCGTIVLLGKAKPAVGKLVGQKLIVMWDNPDTSNPSLFRTSNGTFKGVLISQ